MAYSVYCCRDAHAVNNETVDLHTAQGPPMEKLNVTQTLRLV